MGRKTARKHAFVIVYQLPFYDEPDIKEMVENYLSEVSDFTEDDSLFFNGLIEGTKEHLPEIDSLIERYAAGWEFSRIATTDLAIMRLAIYEMKYQEDVPVSVAINEAVELAKVYGADESPGFINGILGQTAKAL